MKHTNEKILGRVSLKITNVKPWQKKITVVSKYAYIEKSTIFTQSLQIFVKKMYSCEPYFDKVL